MAPNIWKPVFPGDVVCDDKPLFQTVFTQYKSKHCNHCLIESDRLKRCTDCLKMYYCGKYCQTQDWRSYHKFECQAFKKLDKPLDRYSNKILLLLRLYFYIKSNHLFVTKNHRQFDGTDISLKDIKINEKIKTFYNNNELKSLFKDLKNCGIKYDISVIQHWYAFIKKFTNQSVYPLISYECSHLEYITASGIKVGYGLYTKYLTLRHSCCPNSALVADENNRLQLRVMKRVPNGQHLTISYVNLVLDDNDRQSKINGHFIECQCRKCRQHIDRSVDFALIANMTDPKLMLSILQTPTPFLRSQLFANLLIKWPKFLSQSSVVFGNYHPIKTQALRNWLGMLFTIGHTDRQLIESVYKEFVTSIDITHGPNHRYKHQSQQMIRICHEWIAHFDTNYQHIYRNTFNMFSFIHLINILDQQ